MFPPPKAKQLVAEFQASYLHMKGSFCEVTQMVTRGTAFLDWSLALGHWTSHCLSGPQCSRLIRKGLHYIISITSSFLSQSLSLWLCDTMSIESSWNHVSVKSSGLELSTEQLLWDLGAEVWLHPLLWAGVEASGQVCVVAHSWLTWVWPTAPPLALLALWVMGQAHAALCPGHRLLFCGARQLRASGHQEAHVRGSLFLGFFFARVAPTVFAHFHWASSCPHDPPALLTPSRPSQMWRFGTSLCWALGRDSSLFCKVIPFWTLTSSVSHCWISSNPYKKNPIPYLS